MPIIQTEDVAIHNDELCQCTIISCAQKVGKESGKPYFGIFVAMKSVATGAESRGNLNIMNTKMGEMKRLMDIIGVAYEVIDGSVRFNTDHFTKAKFYCKAKDDERYGLQVGTILTNEKAMSMMEEPIATDDDPFSGRSATDTKEDVNPFGDE